jgi:aminobenzoyl-glutamate utilization protein B
MKNILLSFCLFAPVLLFAQKSADMGANKQTAVSIIDAHAADLTRLSDQVWGFAELAMQEYQSAKVLADYAEQQGFKVDRGVAGIPTAFVASYGAGRPVIGVMGEFDALPGLSQKAQPVRAPQQEGAPGHGCGHNMFGPGSLGAAIAIKELIEAGKLKGTVRFYGTPAEEDLAGKVYMTRAGLFDDLDVCLDWHPSDETEASVQSTQAVVDYDIEFRGHSAHAAYDPWDGRSALDAMELCAQGVNYLREHIKPSVRIHYVFKNSGDIPNVIPEYARMWIWVRDSKRTGVEEVWKRIEKIAQGAALMTETEVSVKLNNGLYEQLVNRTGAAALQKNLELLGPIRYTPEETGFGKSIQAALGFPQTGMNANCNPLKETKPDPDGGSSDVGDVSWNVPEISLTVTTAPARTPWHSWAVVACGGMSIGHKGMLHAAKALALTMVDLYENESLRKEIRAEFEQRKGDQVYKAMIPDGPPPVPAVKAGN